MASAITTAQPGEPLPGYPARAWYRKVPFLSTKPRPLISSFTDPKPSPEASANWFSLLTFSWLNELLTVGYTRPLSQDDLYKLQDERMAQLYADRLEEAWDRQCARAAAKNALAEDQLKRRGVAASRWTSWLPAKLRRTPKPYKPAKPSLAYAMNDVVLVFFWTGGLMKLLADIGTITSPLLLRAITEHVSIAYNSRRVAGAPPAPPLGQGIGLALGLFLVQVAIVFLNVHSFYRGFGTGILLRSALIHATYRRAMKLSNRARVSGGLGSAKLVTLISSDVSRIDYCCQFFHMAWTSIIQIIICLALMVYTLGYSALPGFAFVLLLSPTQSLITRHLFSLRKRSMRWTDARVKGIAELLGGIRLLKSFAWENPYLERIATLRAKELSFLRRRLGWRSANIALAFAVPTIAAVISFITYAATGHDLEAGVIFSALTFFQLLRTPLQFLPVSWNAIADATNAARRVATVFEGETQNEGHPVDENQALALDVKQASFEWDSPPLTVSGGGKAGAPGVAINKKDAAAAEGAGDKPAPVRAARLDAITMRVKRGDLVMIVGGIGSGKSSLISAIAGEMRLTDGSVTLGGSVGMCAQSAWILSTTVRNNILFGKEYDEERYNRVVKDAQLLPDFAMLPAGDQTVVGEKGLSLSGGQRQRLNIARAVYHDDDVVLLDDCFSALDAHVGEAVFRQVLLGSLRQKTRILATHALHLLPNADYIYTLENGRIAEQGTYTQLMSGSGAFSKYVEKFGGANGSAARMQDGEGEEKKAVEAEATPDDEAKEKAKKKKQEQSKAAAVMQAEERYMGSVSKHTYAAYFGAGNLPLLLPLFVIAVAVFQGSTVMSPLWLLWWQQKEYGLKQGVYMGVYAALGVTQALGLLSMGQVFALFTYYSSATLHKRALHRIAHAPAAFFDTTPLGRITHRFSKDVDVVDNVIGDAIRTFLGTCVQVVGSIVLIAYLTPYFLIAVGVMVFLYLWTGQYYRTSGRELRRLDAVLRSQIYEHFSESISGVSTIRAYGEAATFVRENAKRIDIENRAYWMSMACQRWLSIRLDSFGALLVLAVGMLTVGTRFTISPGETGVALSYILTAQSVWSWVIRQSAEIENNMSAVERLVYYADKVDMEPPHDVPDADAKLPANWPVQGEICFDNVVAAHRPGLPAVLKGISLTVGAGEHVAVCGRTGAGKSTLVTLTLRMMELSAGSIRIDGVDIATLGLRALRSNVSVIPQDALLFSGTLRYNLDPLGTRDDVELNDAMRRACLVRPPLNGSTSSLTVLEERRSLDNATPLSLDTNIEEEGRNLSVGQRALVSMARALVRQTQIVILDEATASVDYSTDAAIQRALSLDMASRTLITVAHRLSSTLAYDRICMLDAGEILELGAPLQLWDRGPVAGAFRQMCDSSNIARVDIERAQIERRALRVSNGNATATTTMGQASSSRPLGADVRLDL